jgi:hypothetical protein
MLWIGIGLSAVVAVYVAQRELAANRGAEPPASARSLPALTERGTVEPSPVITRVEEPSWTTVGDMPAAAGKPAAGSDPAQAPSGTSSPKLAGAKTGAKVAKGASQDSKSMSLPLPAEYDGSAAKPAEPDSQPQLAGSRVASPSPAVDGGQLLASAMQKCGNEGLFSKFICEEKAFLQYCEDKWDKDPKCMRKGGER